MPESTQEVNVRVAVRVRPLLPKEKLANEQSCVRVIPANNQLVLGKDRTFTFDTLLPSKTGQNDTYKKCVDSLVRSCFDGYNATVFAYGQTGSGKTYTIGGGNIGYQTEEEMGIMPRAIRHVYEITKTHPERQFTIKISYIELYREELVDLLDLDSGNSLNIREDEKGNTLIIGASEVPCESADEVMACLERGAAYRHTGSTQMNEQSSRSHTIFTILLEQRWTDEAGGGDITKEKKGGASDETEVIEDGDMHHYVCAKFHFVDLAGSERAHRTGNIGDRFKESVHINTGLLALGNVISALGDPKRKVTSHIPYRDSKITRLLKDSLGGNAQTLMICCISPAACNFDESLNALKYANRARNIKNKPIVNRDPQSIKFEEMQCEIKALREELSRQRSSMLSMNVSSAPNKSESNKPFADAGIVRELEEKVARLQTECNHYRMIAEEAYKQFQDIGDRNILTQSMNMRLRDWLELMEEIKNKVPHTLSSQEIDNPTITQLQKELNQAKNDLKSDEEIFAEKGREVAQLQERIQELEQDNVESARMLEEAMGRQKQQEQKLVEQQMKLEELAAKLKERDQDDLELDTDELMNTDASMGPPTTSRRAKSVPAHMLGNRSARNNLQVPPQRKIHTSPALFSLERVMANFRARSQLLVSRVEDYCDDVNQQRFSDSSFDEDNDDAQSIDSRLVSSKEDVKSQVSFVRNTSSRGTYRVVKPKFSAPKSSTESNHGETRLPAVSQTDDEKWIMHKSVEGLIGKTVGGDPQNRLDISRLQSSTELQKKRLKQTAMEVRQSTQKMRDLSINIRLKEQLIKELVKTGHEAQAMNHQYEEKIKSLEKEKQAAKQELTNLQKAMQDVGNRDQNDKAQKEQLQSEFRKKMEAAKSRIHSLVKRQKDTERIATMTGANDKRIHDLEDAVDKMKQQQDLLQKRLKDECERKTKLERDMAKEQQRIRELELRNEQQKKVLKVKTEEAAAAQRKLRTTSGQRTSGDEHSRIEEQKRWIDAEIEKVLNQRKEMETLQKELEKREDIIKKKECMMAEKSELEMKKLRSSQLLSKDMLSLTNKLDNVERKIDEKCQEAVLTPRAEQSKLKEELKALNANREKMQKQRELIDAKMSEGSVLPAADERRLIEIDEGIEALDAAIEYRNDGIAGLQQNLRASAMLSQSESNLLLKLNSLSVKETKVLLSRYFEKVIDLRDTERKKQIQCSELEMKIDEQQEVIQEMETALQRAAMETDRRLTQQQQEYERKIQVLMRQLAEMEESHQGGGAGSADNPEGQEILAKVQKLEKDLYYYKKTSRDLKRRLRELLASSATPDLERDDTGLEETPREVNPAVLATPRVPGGHSARSNSHNSDHFSAKSSSPRMDLPEIQTASSRNDRSARSSRLDHGELSARNDASQNHRGSSNVSSARGTVSSIGRLSQQLHDGVTPVRISRKDLRRMSDEEVCVRMSRASVQDPSDSLEASSNSPWT